MEIWNLTQAEIDAAHARAEPLQQLDLPASPPLRMHPDQRAAMAWREKQRRAQWWDKVILWASAIGIVAIIALLATGVMR